MKMALVFLSFVCFTVSVKAQKACIDYFKVEEKKIEISDIINDAAKVLDEVRVLRDKINFWRNFTGDSGRKSLNDIRMHKKYFIFLFKNAQDATLAVEQYRDVFLNVELGYFRLTQLEKDLASTSKKGPTKSELIEIKKKFAESYADYMYIRAALEKLAEPGQSAAESAQYVLQSLGTPSFVSAKTAKVISRPSIEAIHNFFRENPELLILKLKGDLSLQRKYAIRLIPSTLTQIETIQALVLKVVPERYRSIVGGFIGLNYNSYVLKIYMPDIETVIETPNSVRNQRLEVLRVISANKNTDEFLTTFARLTLYTKEWVDLKKSAEALKDEALYNKFFQQILTAEQKAIKADSWLTPFYQPSFIDHVRVWLGPIVGIAGTDYLADGFNIPAGVWQTLQLWLN